MSPYKIEIQKYINPTYFIGFIGKKFFYFPKISCSVLFSSILRVSSLT